MASIFASPTFRPGAPIGGSPFSNFRTTIGPTFSTPDLEVIRANTERSRRAQDLLTQARLAQAQRDNLLLQQAASSPSDIRSLFSKSTDPRQQELQRLVQGDINARERGVALIPTWKEMQQYEKGILSNLNLAENINDARFSRPLREAQLAQQQARDLAAMFNQQQLREQARQNAAAQERYRQAQIANAESNRQQRGQQFGITQAQRDLQTMLEMERMLQNQANEEARMGRNVYQDAAQAAASGALPQSDIRSLFGQTLDPAMLSLVEGYARQYRTEDQQLNDFLRSQAASANMRLQAGGEDAMAMVPTIQQELNKDRNLAGRIFFDPATGAFRSTADEDIDEAPLSDDLGFDVSSVASLFARPQSAGPARPQAQPQPQRPRFTPAPANIPNGARVRSGGRLWQNQNGYMVPVG